MYRSKNILFMLPLFKKRKSHKFSNFSYPGSRKVLTSAKVWYLAKNVVVIWCWTVWSNFVHISLMIEQKIKKWWRGGSNGHPPTYLTSKKPNPFRVNWQKHRFNQNEILSSIFSQNVFDFEICHSALRHRNVFFSVYLWNTKKNKTYNFQVL